MSENSEDPEKYVWLTKEEYDDLTNKLKSFADYQRLMSVILVIGLAMVILHITTDLFFNLTGT